MKDPQPSNGPYFYEAMSAHPAYHFAMSPRDMARFGQAIFVVKDLEVVITHKVDNDGGTGIGAM